MNNERLNKIRIIFEQNKPIVKTAILRENKVSSRDIIAANFQLHKG